jgi:mRNA-degrading endonuclease YafQ of YafQ-DinJ toxin-antitoxin module
MTYRLIFTKDYEKRAQRFLKKHANLLNQYRKTLELLELNPSHPSLRLHKLEGRLRELHSVSINRSYRIVLHFLISGADIILIDVGDHDSVY